MNRGRLGIAGCLAPGTSFAFALDIGFWKALLRRSVEFTRNSVRRIVVLQHLGRLIINP